MIRQKWNDGWKFLKNTGSAMMAMFGVASGQEKEITLPYDAMIHELRDDKAVSGAQTGFYPGGQYTYTKRFDAPMDWKNKTVTVEFEGVYQTAMVYINGSFIRDNKNGYTEFSVTLDDYLKYGESNEIKVIADNSAMPNSRWYSGSGIYRDVNLLVADKVHIALDGLKIRTVTADKDYAQLAADVAIENLTNDTILAEVIISVHRNDEPKGTETARLTLKARETGHIRQYINVDEPDLWNCDHPELYSVECALKSAGVILDRAEELFGIRTLTVDPRYGVRINGDEVKLRGTCIHHDNGILGASTYEAAEFRKARLIKEAGFNSIRSAHHPMGRAMLRACDYYGILVMDELSDVWTIHKNDHDFASNFSREWENVVTRMVNKDYNRPSVILYSTGNEIPEIGSADGSAWNRAISNLFHEMDPYRYTTNGLNGMMALAFTGKFQTVMKDVAAQVMEKRAANGQGDGVGAMNSMMGIMSGEGADLFACHPVLSETIEESELATDVIGLNYLTGRHELEATVHPNRALVGTETYPADIARLWDIVERNHHVIGDFTWTGYDYLGEAGCGIFHYDDKQNFANSWPERAAYIGDIDLIGYRRPISYYREIAYGLRKDPYIAVMRMNHNGQTPSKTTWMFKDNISSWTWHGFEGQTAAVDVYSDSEEVELYLNGRSLGSKRIGETEPFTATFDVVYEPGELRAVSYNGGEISGEYVVETAQNVQLSCSDDVVDHGESLHFVTIGFCDQRGTPDLSVQEIITIEVSGAELLALGSADPSSDNNYFDVSCDTFDGRAMAVIRKTAAESVITIRSGSHGERKMEI